jgi:hypothetical protein
MTGHNTSKRAIFLAFIFILVITLPIGVAAKGGPPPTPTEPVNEDERPSSHYDSILYSEIGAKLDEIASNSQRVRVEIMGESAGGRDLYLVTLSDPQTMGRLGRYQAIRRLMLTDPEAAQEMLEQMGDVKVPIFINGSIHGDEYPGVDAAIQLIETLAYDDSEEIRDILESVILLVNVVANPDGRVLGTRSNANGFDLNRDFITQSQPETQAMARLIAEWNPMVVLDLHGFVNPMLIEPCTPLHNPNYEYDLYIKWAYYEAEAMEAELLAQTGLKAQIPFRDDGLGWDDWAPTYTPMYAMYHGAYGHTLETPFEDERGVAAHYAAVWGALKFVAANRGAMLFDQIEIFRRGFLDLPQMRIPDELLNETQFDQYNDLIIKEFPTAYVIPQAEPFQLSEHQAAIMVDFLLANDVQVEQAIQPFVMAGEEFPAGTYVVWMDQPKRGLANTILEPGPDLSYLEGISFYSPPSVWSNPLLWGVRMLVATDELDADTTPIAAAVSPQGTLESSPTEVYAYLPVKMAAYLAANSLLADGETLYRSTESFVDGGRTFPIGTFIIEDERLAQELSSDYALDVYALQALPDNVGLMRNPSVAILGDEGLAHALRAMGFTFDTLSKGDLSTGAIQGYDVLINQNTDYSTLGSAGRRELAEFIGAGGDYVGLGATGSNFAIQAGIIDAAYTSASGNAIVSLNFDSTNTISTGFFNQDYAFVYSPVWFDALGAEVSTSAELSADDFLVSGYWPGWKTSGAAGMPVIIHRESSSTDITLFGIDVTFRGHPLNTFRLLGNAIFSGLD